MKLNNKKHVDFYDWQINVLEEEWDTYQRSLVMILLKEKRLFVGRIWGVNGKTGGLILRFKSGTEPRMKDMYTLCLVGAKAGTYPDDWNFSYGDFRTKTDLSGKNTTIKTMFYLKSDNVKWNFIGVSGAEPEFVNQIESRYLRKGIHPIIVVAEEDPPIKYLLNLKSFVKQFPKDEVLNSTLGKLETDWSPINIDNSNDILPKFIGLIDKEERLVIQGPPGTGKSYLIAQICDHYLQRDFSIVVTALTNKALVEVAEKEGFEPWLKQGRVFKTNLSSDEAKQVPGLKIPEDITPNKGEVLLSTYYKLSDELVGDNRSSYKYDLLIIEEASQAFLATIAGFSTLAKKVLVIGDHKQLMPIIRRVEEALKIHPKIMEVVYGLKTFLLNNEDLCYRLTKTRRLSPSSSKLTGLFYDDQLSSISENKEEIILEADYRKLFADNGGISIVKLPLISRGYNDDNVFARIIDIGLSILRLNTKAEIALLSPNIYVENALNRLYNRKSAEYSRVTINTIHKIQGLTVDFTILYLPMNNPSFELNNNIFNVATSRAKKGTLIITNQSIDMVSNISNEVRLFLSKIQDVSSNFMPLIK